MYKGTINIHVHTPYCLQSSSTNTVRKNQLCLIFQVLSNFFSYQKSSILPPMIVDYDDCFWLSYTTIVDYKLKLKRFFIVVCNFGGEMI